jgi:alpha-mannosidase
MLHLLPLLLGLLVAPLAAQQPKRIYIAPDDHTDYWWTATEAQYLPAFVSTLDYYLDQIDQTETLPNDFHARWNCDGSLWMWAYEQAKTPAEFERLLGRIRDGHISVPLNPLCVCLGGAPVEAVLRGMYYPGRIERRHGVRFPLAYTMENQTQPLGLYSLWAGSGARWSWKGVCSCATRVASSGDREHDMYWGTGIDGSRVLMKWNSMLGQNTSMGGYAEARFPATVVEYVTHDPAFRSRHPYDVIGCFGKGWDDFTTMTAEFVAVAQQKTDATRAVRVSNQEDFFTDFEATYGSAIPTQSLAFGNEWDLDIASLAEATARLRRAVEKLRAAEAMAATAGRLRPALLAGREADRDLAFMDLGLFFEHDFGMSGFSASHPSVAGRIAWQRRLADEIDRYVDALHDDSRDALGEMIPAGQEPRFFVFNPLGWARDDVADLPWNGPTPIHVVDLSTAQEVPSQFVQVGGQNMLRVLASDVPAVGYRVFEVRSGAGRSLGDAGTFSRATGTVVLDNGRYAITVAERGAILSLIDHAQNGLEMIGRSGGFAANDLGSSTGSLSLEHVGPVSIAVRATAASPVPHTTVVTLFRNSDRIEIENRITANFSTTQSWRFTFRQTAPDVHHEEVGAILHARLAPNGHYSTRQARYDWLTLNHFCDMSDASGPGVTLSNLDCAFFRLGQSTNRVLDEATPQVSVLAGGRGFAATGLPSQGGDSLFLQRFALRAHDGYAPDEAMRSALAHQNPLVAGPITGTSPELPDTPYGMISISDPEVLLWAFKPHEDGIEHGLVARLWNVSDQPQRAIVDLEQDTIREAHEVTHLETDRGQLGVQGGTVPLDFARQQIRSVRLVHTLAAGHDDIGAGCADGRALPPRLRLQNGAQPWIGDPLPIELGPVGAGEIPVTIAGFSNTFWGTTPLPLALDPFGFPGCQLVTSPNAEFVMNPSTFGAELTLTIPPAYELMGETLYLQGLVLTPASTTRLGKTSGGIALRLGYR